MALRDKGAGEYAVPIHYFGHNMIRRCVICRQSPWRIAGSRSGQPVLATGSQRTRLASIGGGTFTSHIRPPLALPVEQVAGRRGSQGLARADARIGPLRGRGA